MPNPLQPHELQPTRLFCPWNFPGKNTGMGCHFLLQGIFWTQGSNPRLLHWLADSLPLCHMGSPKEMWANTNESPWFLCPDSNPKQAWSWRRRINMKDEKGFAAQATPRGWNWESGYIVLPFQLLLWYITNIVYSRKAKVTFLCDWNYFTSFQKKILIPLSSIIKQVPQNVSQIQQIFFSALLLLMKIRNNPILFHLSKVFSQFLQTIYLVKSAMNEIRAFF